MLETPQGAIPAVALSDVGTTVQHAPLWKALSACSMSPGTQRTAALAVRLIVAMLALAFTAPTLAQYSFVRIDAGNLTSLYPGTLNNRGEVAFTGFHAGNISRVYKGDGGPLTTVATTGGVFTFLNAPSINYAGEVGFRALTSINGVYRGNGGPVTLIHSASNGVDGAHIDEDGTMALLNNSIGVMTGSGGPTTTIAAYGGAFTGFGTDPDIRSGSVAFAASLLGGGSAIYTSTGGVLTQIEASGGQVLDTQLPRIGCGGSLVWISNLSSGIQAIRTHVAGANATFVDTSGPYAGFGYHFGTGINYYNQVAFSARLDAPGSGVGIYVGPNPVTDKVIGPGDPLAGKIVREAFFGGLNDIGQVSFGVIFSDFTYGVFRADPAVPNPLPNCAVPCAPIITSQPVSQLIGLGGPTVLSVTATGTGPLSYQWRFNGVILAPSWRLTGVNSATLTINPTVAGDAGQYDCVVTNLCGSATSGAGTVTTTDCCGVHTWAMRSSSGPAARLDTAVAYVTNRGRTVLFGGWDFTTTYGDTWEWNGVAATPAWTPVSATGPSARHGHSMSVDDSGHAMLFGGTDSGGLRGDTWRWDGVTWTNPISASNPPPRSSHAVAYDTARGVVVLFGGDAGGGNPALQDTWEWSADQWTMRSAGGGPSGRTGHAMAYDAGRQRVILYGGLTAAGEAFDMWEWDGVTGSWTELTPPAVPPLSLVPGAGVGHTMAYDAICDATIFFGGSYSSGSMFIDNTWRFGGSFALWHKLAPAAMPAARHRHGMTYDSDRGRMVLFGGSTGAGLASSDTWEWGSPGVAANDPCTTATAVITKSSYPFATCGAATDGPATVCGSGRDVWFRYTPACSGVISVSTCGSRFDTVVDIFSSPATNCTTLTAVDCNDDAAGATPCTGSFQSYKSFAATALTRYYIRVGGAGMDFGSGTLTVSGPLPAPGTCPPSSATTSTRLFRVLGASDNSAWAWRLSSPCTASAMGTDMYQPNVPGVSPVGAPASDLAAAFVANINNAALNPCSAGGRLVATQFTGVNDNLFSVRVNTIPINGPFLFAVGPAFTAPDALCVVVDPRLPTTGPCLFNPPIVEEPLSGLDCNGNGQDDLLDTLDGTSADADHNGVPDECIPPSCPCDWNGDVILNSQDFFDFVNALFGGDADFNGDATTNSQDFFDFLNCFFNPPGGCP